MSKFLISIASLAILAMSLTSESRANQGTPQTYKLTAQQITAANVDELQQRGPDAWGGIGDWHLSNGTICATVSAIAHESDLSARGGSLVDLGFCGRPDDQFVALHDLLNGSTAQSINAYRVEAFATSAGAADEGTGQSAAIRVYSGSQGLAVETTFSVSEEQPTQLQVRKRIWRQQDDAPDFFAYVPVLFNYHSMQTFALDSQSSTKGSGFIHQGFFDKGASAFGAASQPVDTIVALGSPNTGLPISYGWQLRSAERHRRAAAVDDTPGTKLPRFALTDQGSTVFLIAADTFMVGDGERLGLPQLLQLPIMGLDPDDEITTHETLYVSAQGDTAGITDQLFPGAPVLKGKVNAAHAVVHVNRSNGIPFSFVHTNARGAFALRLPQDAYQLHARAPGGLETSITLEQTAESSPTLQIELPAPARLLLPQGEALRLVFQGMGDTPDPQLDDPLTGYTIYDDSQSRQPPPMPAVFLTGVAAQAPTGGDSDFYHDPSHIDLPPGKYRVFATRGIEYTVTQATINMLPGQTVPLAIDIPQRAVATPGVIAADFHVHSAPSMDNGFATVDRVRTFAAEHGEIMVAAEHETAYDFSPLLQKMQVTQKMIAISGTEMTGQVPTTRMPHTAGHANFFPLPVQTQKFRRGVPNNEDRRLREVLYEVNKLSETWGQQIVSQLNHARENDQFLTDLSGDVSSRINNGAYFDHMGPAAYPYDPTSPLTSAPNNTLIEPDPVTGVRDIDFDAMEVLNGPHGYSPTRRRALLADWFSLLNQGVRLSGTANSDSHNKAQQVSLPRNMVSVTNDTIEQFNTAEFVTSIKDGRLYGTTGPIINLALNGHSLGETFAGAQGTLTGRVDTAPWVDAKRLRVLVNGEPVHTSNLSADGTFNVPLAFDKDSHVVVDVEGDPGEIYKVLYPRQVPYAFTNPIYVDADGNGRWQPPGLP